MGIGMTKKALADAAGYTYRRLYDIDAKLPDDEKLFVPCSEGKYDLSLFIQRWLEYNLKQERGEEETLEDVKTRHERIKAEKSELEVKKMRGELLDAAEVVKLWGDIITGCKQNLLRLPSAIAPMVAGMENIEAIVGIMDAEIRRELEQIANTPLPDYAEDKNTEKNHDDS